MTETYEVEGRRVGVRWNRAGVDGELRGLAGAARGVGDAPPNISIVLGDAAGQTRTKHRLYVQNTALTTGSSDGGLVRAVLRSIAALTVGTPSGALRVSAFMLIAPDGQVSAVDLRLATELRRLEPRLRRSGHRIVALPHLHVRPETGTAVVPDCASVLGVARDRLERRWPRRGTDDDLVAGELGISRLVYGGRPEPASRAAAIAEMVPLVRDGDGRVQTGDVAMLAALASRVQIAGTPGGDPKGLRVALGLDAR